jgi:hypothetical protein
MLSCKEASELLSQGQDRSLKWGERMSVRMHVWICNNCRRFERQLKFIRSSLRYGSRTGQLPVEKPLPPESAERIRKALHDHHHGE